MSLERPVRTLNPEVARKIAAGEVIDRPNAIVRELMDNAIDAGATSITVEISGGGIDRIRIIDDGAGMTREDLANCARPHATSKISTEVDLMNLSTLGFRGEALASIAAVSRLSIQSGGFKMRASLTEDHIIEPAAELKGTIVQAEGLFENFPARRQFLKRPATEGIMCRSTFIEKALARPDISFRFVSEGETKLDLPAGQPLKERFVRANGYSEAPELFYEFGQSSEGGVVSSDSGVSEASNSKTPEWAFTVVIGEPAVSRSNKKDIFIYANGRRIQEYSLVQAVEYGGQGFFPNGTYPVAAVFAQVRPDLIDFNIHPAKREARFSDISALHHGLSSTIRSFFQQYTYSNFSEDKAADEPREQEFDFSIHERHISYKPSEIKAEALSDFRSKYLGIKTGGAGASGFESLAGSERTSFSAGASPSGSAAPAAYKSSGHSSYAEYSTRSLAEQALAAAAGAGTGAESEETSSSPSPSQSVKYIGPCLGTFLLAEKNNCLYIIDQHAVHERILFDRLMNSQGQGGRQNLLIPYKIKTESKSQDNQLEKLKAELTRIGFETEHVSDGYWEITTIPERWTGTEYDLRTLLFVKQVEPAEIIRAIAAMTACKAAVKDGYVLDDITAARLVEQAFTLEDPHCPHGRPVYTVISREKLFEMVKRT